MEQTELTQVISGMSLDDIKKALTSMYSEDEIKQAFRVVKPKSSWRVKSINKHVEAILQHCQQLVTTNTLDTNKDAVEEQLLRVSLSLYVEECRKVSAFPPRGKRARVIA